MNNPYNQFNIRPRLNARLQAVQPYYSNNSGLNFRGPTLGTVRLRSPTAAYDNQGLHTALPSNTPVIPAAINGSTDFKAVTYGELFGSQTPAYMANCNSGMAVVPVIQLGAGNQTIRLQQRTNFPGTMGIGVRSGVEANNLMQQFVPRNMPALLQNRVPFMQPEVTPVRPAYSVPTFPGVPIIRSSMTNVLPADVTIPFRPVQWFPGAVHRTGIPQVPYAVEIKPDNIETPQNDHFQSGGAPVINNTFTVNDGSWKPESASGQSEPTVYMDIAMDSNMGGLNSDKRTAGMWSFDNDNTVRLAAVRPGKRKGDRHENMSGVKVSKLPAIKPCVVSLVRIDSVGVGRPSSNSSVETVSAADDCELSELDVDDSPVPEVEEVSSNQDIPVPVIEAESTCDNESDGLIGSDEEVGEDVTHEDDNRSVNADRLICSDEEVGDEDVPHEDDNCSVNADRLIGSDEDVGTEDQPHDDDNCSTNADVGTETSVRYEVTPTDSDALLFDMECDGGKPGETLRVMLPTKRSQTTDGETGSAVETVLPPPSSGVLGEIIAASDSDVVLVDADVNKSGRRMQSALLPTKKLKTTNSKAGSTKKKTVLPPKKTVLPPKKTVFPAPKSKQSCKIPKSAVISIDEDNSDDDDDVIIAYEAPTTTNTSSLTRLRRTAASACKEKISAAQNGVESIEIERSENSLLGVPLQASFFRFEAQSAEVFRLLSMEKGCVPLNVLTRLTDLVASADATVVDGQSPCGDASNEAVARIPQGGSRTLLFQCLFCPYAELSAKRVMAHVKQQHHMYASFIQCRLLPIRRIPLHVYCRHCNFIAYDSAAMFIHFAVYHKVPGILLPQPKDIEQDPDWAPVIDPEANAKEFPFYCCPNCRYVDAEWDRMIQHMLKKHSSESVFLGCVVRLIMFGRASKHLGSFTYQSLARQERCRVTRREIYACVSCRFFSFYPTYAFCHHVVSHSSLEMMYVCAATPSCTKRCTSVEDVISHIQGAHVAMKRLQFQCTATLYDALMSTQLDISPGELVPGDVPVHVGRQFSSASINTSYLSAGARLSSLAAIEIEDDDDGDDDVTVLSPVCKDDKSNDVDDVTVLSPVCKDDKSNDVEPESDVSDRLSKCSDGKDETVELASESAASEQNVAKQDPSQLASSSQEHLAGEETVQICREEIIDADVVDISDDETSIVPTNNAVSELNSIDISEDQALTEPVHEQNPDADLGCRVEDETSKIIDCDSQSEGSEQELERAESQSVENPVSACVPGTVRTELVNSDLDSAVPSTDANSLADNAAVDADVDSAVPSDADVDSAVPSTDANPIADNAAADADVDSTVPSHADVDSAVPSTDANPLADNAVAVADVDSAVPSDADVDSAVPGTDANPLSDNAAADADVDSAVPNTDANPIADNAAADADVDSAVPSDADVDSAVPSTDANPLADNALADADSVNHASVPCSDDVHTSTESALAPSPPVRAGTSRTESVNSADDQTTSSKDDMNQLTDAATAVADLVNDTSVASQEHLAGEETVEICREENIEADVVDISDDETSIVLTNDAMSNDENLIDISDAADEGATGSEVHQMDDLSVQEGAHGCTITEAEVMNQLTDAAAAVADLLNDTSVAADDEGAAGSEVHQVDDLSAQEDGHGCTVTEAEGTDQQLTDAGAAEQDPFTSDQSNSTEIFNDWLGFDVDTSELPEFPDDQLESSGRDTDMLGLEEELLLLAEQLTADELQSPDRCSNIKHAASMSSIVSSEDSVNIVGVRDPHVVSTEDTCLARCLDTSDDTLCSDVSASEQLHMQEPAAVSDSVQEHCTEESSVASVPGSSSEIPPESRDSEVTERIDTANDQRNASARTDEPVSENLLRFKSLAGFRFPAPCSFASKPS